MKIETHGQNTTFTRAVSEYGPAGLLKMAFTMATDAHGTQTYSDQPYSGHLKNVYLVLRRHLNPLNPEGLTVLIAAPLHDTLEDTALEAQVIALTFGHDVLALVQAVTDEPGVNRQTRKLATYPKIAAQPRTNELKLGNRIASVQYSLRNNNVKAFQMYRCEDKEFRRHLKPNSGPTALGLWPEYETLLGHDWLFT